MLFSGKENVFMCLIAFQKMFWKIFSGVWLCSWEYHRKHIFYLLLTFSRLPNKYIIAFIPQYRNTNKTQKKKNHQIRSNPVTFSHIFSVAKQIYNIIHSSIQKNKQNPEKKKSSNPVKLREEGRERSDWVRRGAAIGAVLRAKARSRLTQRQDRDRRRNLSSFAHLWVILSLSLFLPLCVCELLSLRVSVPEVIWR